MENDDHDLQDLTDTTVGGPTAPLSVLAPSVGPLYKCVSRRGLPSDLSTVTLSYRAMAICQDFGHSRRHRRISIKSRRTVRRLSMAPRSHRRRMESSVWPVYEGNGAGVILGVLQIRAPRHSSYWSLGHFVSRTQKRWKKEAKMPTSFRMTDCPSVWQMALADGSSFFTLSHSSHSFYRRYRVSMPESMHGC